MHSNLSLRDTLSFCLLATSFLGSSIQAVEKISVVGTRVQGRTADQATSAIEVYDEEAIQRTGQSETGKLLQALSPSFHFSQTTVSDGTDIVRPATLKGMGPDQVLVLVNGKRRHSQALLNVQQTVGRGSAGTDINAIPVAAIKRVEILKQGASAQYGSDAIAGVINIVLKDQGSGQDGFLYGAQDYAGDGTTTQIGASIGLEPSSSSTLQLSAEGLTRGETNRAETDQRFGKRTMRIGEAESQDLAFFANGGWDLSEDTELYAFGGLSRRQGESGGFFREPNSDRNIKSVYPDGFLPLLITRLQDQSVSTGIRHQWKGGIETDLSYTYGRNQFNFGSKNSLNISLGETSPREADDGTLSYGEGSANLDIKAEIDLGWQEPLHVTTGLVIRDESYQILAGDPASWTYGPNNDLSLSLSGQNGNPAPAGIQGFPGFQPSNAVDASRRSSAVFIDLESYLTEKWLVAAASRFEDYEEQGSATTGKIALRYDLSPELVLRSTVSSGFRAPSLAQLNYSSLSTTFAGDRLTETQTTRQGSPTFTALGLENLQNERSLNQSIGFLAKPLANLNVSADYYTIRVQDRLVLSEFLQSEAADSCSFDNSNCPIRRVLSPLNVDAVQFFTNAIDTETRGLDVVGDYAMSLGEGRRLSWIAGYHFNRTQVQSVKAPAGIDPKVIFSEAQTVLTEEGQPRQRYQVGMDVKGRTWNSSLRFNYYGEVAGAGFGTYRQNYDGKWITDANVGYQIARNVQLDVGAQNLFNVYPEAMNEDHPVRGYAGGSFKYSWETTPFGFKGGLYYTRLGWML